MALNPVAHATGFHYSGNNYGSWTDNSGPATEQGLLTLRSQLDCLDIFEGLGTLARTICDHASQDPELPVLIRGQGTVRVWRPYQRP